MRDPIQTLKKLNINIHRPPEYAEVVLHILQLMLYMMPPFKNYGSFEKSY